MAGVLRIEQLEGQSRHTLELSGKALHAQGARWGGVRQRARKKMFAGSGDVTVHLNGPDWLPTELTFRWQTRDLLAAPIVAFDGATIRSADDLRALVHQMAATPVAVLVSWRGMARVAYLSEFEASEGQPGDWGCTLEVEWLEGERRDPTTSLDRPKDFRSSVLGMVRDWERELAKVVRPANVARDSLADAERAVSAVNSAFGRAAGVVEEYRNVVRDVDAVQGHLGETMEAVIDGSNDLRATVDRPASALVASDDPEAQLEGMLFQQRILRAGRRAKGRAAIERRRRMLEERDDLIGVYLAHEDEDIRLVAHRFYGSVDPWQQVAAFNELTGTGLTAGQRILLPRIEGVA